MKNYELNGEYVYNILVPNPINHIAEYDLDEEIYFYCGDAARMSNLKLGKFNRKNDINCGYCSSARARKKQEEIQDA